MNYSEPANYPLMHSSPLTLNVAVLGEGLPLVAIHGVFGSGDNLRLLSRLPMQVHLPDMRNHGHSPHHQDASLKAMAQDVLAYMDHQGMDKTHLLGHSMGGKVAMYLAMNFPKRVNKLIVVDIIPRDYPFSQMPIFESMEKIELAKVSTREAADRILSENISELAVRQFLLKSLKRLPEGWYGWKIAWRYLKEAYATWGCTPVTTHQLYDGSGALIYGMESEFVSLQDHAIMRQHFPHLDIVGIADAGHWLHAQQPEIFLQEVERILLQ